MNNNGFYAIVIGLLIISAMLMSYVLGKAHEAGRQVAYYEDCVYMFKEDVRNTFEYGNDTYGVEYYVESEEETDHALVIVYDYHLFKVLAEGSYSYVVLHIDDDYEPHLEEIVWAE